MRLWALLTGLIVFSWRLGRAYDVPASCWLIFHSTQVALCQRLGATILVDIFLFRWLLVDKLLVSHIIKSFLPTVVISSLNVLVSLIRSFRRSRLYGGLNLNSFFCLLSLLPLLIPRLSFTSNLLSSLELLLIYDVAKHPQLLVHSHVPNDVLDVALSHLFEDLSRHFLLPFLLLTLLCLVVSLVIT